MGTEIAHTTDLNQNEGDTSDRAQREAQVTSSQTQATFADTVVEPVQNEYDETYQDYHGEVPFEEFTLAGAMSRVYNLGTIAWTSLDVRDDMKADLHFPDELMKKDFIFQKMDGFKYFRGGVRLQFRINSTVFNSGMLIAAWRPIPTQSNDILPISAAEMASWPHVLISASTNAVAELTIPFIWNRNMLNLKTAISDFKAGNPEGLHRALAQVTVRVLLPLNSSLATAPGDVSVNIFANFVDAALYVPDPIEGQSGLLAGLGAEVASGLASSAVSGVASAAAGEAISAAKSGIDNMNKTGGGGTPSVSNIPIIGGMMKKAKDMLSMVGLQKPTSVATVDRRILDYGGDMNLSTGVDNTQRTMPNKAGYVSSDPSFAGIKTQEDALSHMIRTPSIVYVGELKTSTPTLSFTMSPALPRTETSGSFDTILGATCKAFHKWRGGLKYSIKIIASQNVAARIKFSLDNVATDDVYYKVVSVEGETEVNFYVPFLSDQYYLGPQESLGFFTATLESAVSTPGAVDYPLRLIVYVAGGEDFGLFWPGGNQVEAQCYVRDEFDEPFEPFHESFTYAELDGVALPDEFASVKDVLGYYAPAIRVETETGTNSKNLVVTSPAHLPWVANSLQGAPLPVCSMRLHFQRMFSLFRGSTRFKAMVGPTSGNKVMVTTLVSDQQLTNATSVLQDTLPYYGSPLIVGDTSYRSMVDFEVPYNEPLAFLPVQPNGPVFLSQGTNVVQKAIIAVNLQKVGPTHGSVADTDIFIAAGDDFRFGFLHGPGNSTSSSVSEIGFGSRYGLLTSATPIT